MLLLSTIVSPDSQRVRLVVAAAEARHEMFSGCNWSGGVRFMVVKM